MRITKKICDRCAGSVNEKEDDIVISVKPPDTKSDRYDLCKKCAQLHVKILTLFWNCKVQQK